MKICGRILKVYFPIFAKLHCGLAVVNVEHILRLALLLQFLNLNSNILLSETPVCTEFLNTVQCNIAAAGYFLQCKSNKGVF